MHRLWVALILLVATTGIAAAQEQTAPRIWQIPFGTTAGELDTYDLIDPSCGTNGGPAGLELQSFTEFAKCAVDESGYHEVWFRYDDTLEYMARALRNPIQIGRYLATAIAGHPVVVSLLLDDDGKLRGFRVHTDSRAPESQRIQAHALAANLKAALGQGWECVDLPPAEGEEAIQRVFVKQDCGLSNDRLNAELQSRYLFKPGQHIVDLATGKPTTNIFESTTVLEALQVDPFVDEPPLDRSAEQSPTDHEATAEARFLAGLSHDCPDCELEGADLRRRDLTRADLSGANLSRATFHRATLRETSFEGAQLFKANFNLADLSLTNFAGADLSEAILFRARGARTDFSGATLSGAKMGEITIRQANFSGATLIETDLGGADLNRSDFSNANLSGSYLFQIKLLRADFSGVTMNAANLDGALLRDVNFTRADAANSDLQNADLRGADLTNANFSGVRFSFANLRDTIQRGTDLTGALMPR